MLPLDVRTWDAALHAVRMSEAAYHRRAAAAAAAPACVLRAADRRARAVLCVAPDRAVTLAVRGTVIPLNLSDALDARPTRVRLAPRDREVVVHRGFARQWRALEPSCRPALRAAVRRHGPHTVRFVGHSMGGAVAALMAAAWAEELRPARVEVITFGCPPFADEAFGARVRALADVMLHLRVGGDVVPHARLHPAYAPLPGAAYLPAPDWSGAGAAPMRHLVHAHSMHEYAQAVRIARVCARDHNKIQGQKYVASNHCSSSITGHMHQITSSSHSSTGHASNYSSSQATNAEHSCLLSVGTFLPSFSRCAFMRSCEIASDTTL